MYRKRSLLSDICDVKRRKLNSNRENLLKDADIPRTTSCALLYLSKLFPSEKFQNRLPPIVMRHQIYAFVKSRTEVDKHLNDMRKRGEIRLFKLGMKDDEIAVVYMQDYRHHVEKCNPNNPVVGYFLNSVVDKCPDFSFSKTVLINEYGIREENISELIQMGLLTSYDVGCYLLSVPLIGQFMKTFLYGRRATLQYVRRTKYKEILQSELEQRKLPKKALCGILYHIYDIIGSDSVKCIETSTGTVLRLHPDYMHR